jgi:hypothetical protein
MNSDIDRLSKALEGFDYREVRAHSRLERAYERWPLLAAVHRAIRTVSQTHAAEPGRPASVQGAAAMWEE